MKGLPVAVRLIITQIFTLIMMWWRFLPWRSLEILFVAVHYLHLLKRYWPFLCAFRFLCSEMHSLICSHIQCTVQINTGRQTGILSGTIKLFCYVLSTDSRGKIFIFHHISLTVGFIRVLNTAPADGKDLLCGSQPCGFTFFLLMRDLNMRALCFSLASDRFLSFFFFSFSSILLRLIIH